MGTWREESVPVRRSLMMTAAAAAACSAGLMAGVGPAAAGPSAPSWRVHGTDTAAAPGGIWSQRDGVWGKALTVPGLGVLNSGGGAGVGSVSCPSPGSCSAGGSYTDRSGHVQGFVVSERNDFWGKAREVPGLGALNVGGGAWIKSVSCASPGNCAAGGTYGDSSHHAQGFVVSEVSGSWGKALEVPGLAALNTAGVAVVWSVSCPSAGNCAGGYYRVYSGGVQTSRGFVVSQRNGTWGKARRVSGPSAWVESVSCPSAGNCGAGGFYLDSSGHGQGFVLSQRDGVWGKALTVPGLALRCPARPQANAQREGATLTRPARRGSCSESTTAYGATRLTCPGSGRSMPGSTPGSCRYHARPPGTAGSADTTTTPPATPRDSWSASATARGALPSRSTSPAAHRSCQCRAFRRGTAVPAGCTRIVRATVRASLSAR